MPSDPPRQQHPVDRAPCLRGSPGQWTARRICLAHLAHGPCTASVGLTWPVDRTWCLQGSPGQCTTRHICLAHLARGPRTASAGLTWPADRARPVNRSPALRPQLPRLRPTHRASTRATHCGVPKPPAVALDLKESAEETAKAPSGDTK